MNSTHVEALGEFVDANILLYAFDFGAMATPNLSVQVLQEFFVTVTRKVARPFSIEEAADHVRAFAAWRIFSPVAEDVLAAIALHENAQLSWTEDLSDGQTLEGVLIRSPFK